MQVRQLAHTIGHAGSNGAWRAYHTYEEADNKGTHEIWHYGTLMLRWWTEGHDGAIFGPVKVSTGHGSVSDQGGMNQIFRALGLPLYFSRKGGAEIIRTQPEFVQNDETWYLVEL